MNSSIEWAKLASRGKNFSILLVSSVARSFSADSTKKEYGISTPKHYRQLDDSRYFNKRYVNNIVKEFQEMYILEPKRLLNISKKYQEDLLDLRDWTKCYKEQNFKNYTNQELIDLWNNFLDKSDKVFSIVYGYIFLNKFLPDILVEVVSKKEKNIIKANEHLNILLSMNKDSDSKKEKESLLKIVKVVDQGNLKLNNRGLLSKIDEHLSKYSFLGQYYYNRKPYTRADIIRRIKTFLKSDYRKEVMNLNKQKKNSIQTEKIIDKLKLNKGEKLLVEMLKEWAFAANSFDENYTESIFNLNNLIKISARRLDIKKEQLCEMLYTELLQGLKKGKVNEDLKHDLNLRIEDNAMIFENNKLRVLTGSKLKAYAKKELKYLEIDKNIKELKGQPAQLGIRTGKARLMLNLNEIPKMKKGEILIATATTPSYVPAMEKAAAIITDEGGLLSHAAIVSRELGVPCIVGTKMGTRVIKTGDLIEVNADTGIIKILEN